MSTNNSYKLKPSWKLSVYLIVLLVLVPTSGCLRNDADEYSVHKGQFVQSVIEKGELQSVHATFVSMPQINYEYGYNFKILGIAEHGQTVHKGDTVIRVDPSAIEKFIIERSEILETEIASRNKLKAQLTNNLQDLRSQLRNEQASWEIKKLAMEKSGFESVSIRKVAELEFRQEDIKLNKIKRTLAVRPKLDSLDLHIQEIKVSQKENELKAAQATLHKMLITTPREGIFVVEDNWRTGQKIRAGDDVYLGNPVARIPDVRTMKVNGYILENDISKIKRGMEVIVRLDALPQIAFHGRLTSLGVVCIEKDDRRVFPAEVIIAETDPRLKPGMTVSCEYITYSGESEIYVPSSCIMEEDRHFYLFVRGGGKTRKTSITTGPSNNLYTIVSGDIKEGQRLFLPDKVSTAK